MGQSHRLRELTLLSRDYGPHGGETACHSWAQHLHLQVLLSSLLRQVGNKGLMCCSFWAKMTWILGTNEAGGLCTLCSSAMSEHSMGSSNAEASLWRYQIAKKYKRQALWRQTQNPAHGILHLPRQNAVPQSKMFLITQKCWVVAKHNGCPLLPRTTVFNSVTEQFHVHDRGCHSQDHFKSGVPWILITSQPWDPFLQSHKSLLLSVENHSPLSC